MIVLVLILGTEAVTVSKILACYSLSPSALIVEGQLSRRTSFFGNTLQMFPLLCYHQEIYLKRSIWVRNGN